MSRYPLAALTLALLAAPALAAPLPSAPPPRVPLSTQARTLEDSVGVLDGLAAIPLKGIPPKLLADAQGVVIIPRVVKLGFVVGARGGHGVALTRTKDGVWGDPVFVHFGGASFGFQAGIESADVVLVFRNRKSLDRVLEGREKLTLGLDASVAAGPVGREAMAATDAQLGAEVLSYSRARGLFAGVAIDGAVIHSDTTGNDAFRVASAEEKKLVEQLRHKLVELSGTGTRDPFTAPTSPPPVLQPPVSPKRPRLRPFRPWLRRAG